jgi:hypothetical protein
MFESRDALLDAPASRKSSIFCEWIVLLTQPKIGPP